LAARGQRFTNAVGSFHQTTMSMGALFTGRTPSLERAGGEPLNFNSRTWCGMARFAVWDEPGYLPRSLTTLPERLRDAGYQTIGISSNRLLFEPAGFERGFDEWRQVSYASRRPHKDVALEKRVQARDVDRVTTVARVDAGIGVLLEALASDGLLEDAAVIFTADHGERLGEEHLVKGREGHWGEPSFQEGLRVPLIVAPPRFEDTGRLIRSEDTFRLITTLAGLDVEESAPLAENELFLSEGPWWTYRQGRWKSFARRDGQASHLVDLGSDPAELYDVAPLHPEIQARHHARIAELVESLGATTAVPEELTPEDEDRLGALGYLE
jgi:arylsulfatase A-like enzyme